MVTLPDPELRAHARQVALVRLLLVTLGFGVLAILTSGREPQLVEPAAGWLHTFLVVATVLSVTLLASVRWVRRPWQLALHLAADVVWTGVLLWLSGGPASSGVIMLFLIVLTGTLMLPGVFPFVLPTLASLVLAIDTLLYLADQSPLSPAFRTQAGLANPARLVSLLAIQVAALFAVDLLGQVLVRRLRESRIFTGELLDQLGEGVLAIDGRGVIAYANAEAVRLLALSEPVQGRRVAELLAGPTFAPVLALVHHPETPQLERFAGPSDRQLLLRITALTGPRGDTIGRTLLIADETRLRILEDNARRGAHLASLGEMAAGIAHEIRNPLTSLRGCAQEIAEMSAEAHQPDAEALARILVTESDRLARIVEDFLSLSRLRPPQRRPVPVEPVFDELRRLCAARRDLPPGLTVQITCDDDCCDVEADPGQLRQILTNLINNAIEALRNTQVPALHLSATMAGADNPLRCAAVCFQVSDNGSGIPSELHEQVFTPFFSTKSQGTGLGLSLVGRIVREHEGVVVLNSAKGVGTTLTIFLPAHSQTRTFKRALGSG